MSYGIFKQNNFTDLSLPLKIIVNVSFVTLNVIPAFTESLLQVPVIKKLNKLSDVCEL